MKFALINMLKDPSQVSRAVQERIANALERQSYEHVAPFWEADGAEVVVADSPDVVLPLDYSPLLILDTPDQLNELGDHFFDGVNVWGRAFLAPILVNGGTLTSGANSLSQTLSHELIEPLIDPYTNLWADRAEAYQQVAYEACDPCEDQSYEIDGIAVSDFVGPRWFRKGPGPFNWLRTLDSAYAVTLGGYTIDESVVASEAGARRNRETTWGPLVPQWKKDLKLHSPSSRMRKRLGI